MAARLLDVSFKYASNHAHTLTHIDLEAKQGQLVLLLGESGCGKTTITRLINKLAPLFHKGEVDGHIFIAGEDIKDKSLGSLAGTVGSVFQDPRSQFFTTDTRSEIAFTCENLAFPRQKIHDRILGTAGELNITHLLDRNIFELSSGEKQMVAIASVQAVCPPIVLMDEPTANLDGRAMENLQRFFVRLKKKGVTIIVSEHRYHYLKGLADRAFVIEKGRIAKQLSQDELKDLSNTRANGMGLRCSRPERLKLPQRYESAGRNPGLAVENVSFMYSRQQPVLNEVSFSACKGEVVGIIGKNGTGKTTLVEVVCGLKKEGAGRVCLGREPLPPKKRMKRTYLVMQDSGHQLFGESVEKELLVGAPAGPGVKKKAAEILKQLGLASVAAAHPATLSGGQKQRLAIGVAMMRDGELVCLDEPTSGLDYKNMMRAAQAIKAMAGAGKTVLVITHDYEFLIAVCTHVLHLKKEIQFFPVNETNKKKIFSALHEREE